MRTAALNLLVIAIAEHWVVDVEVKNRAGGGGGGAGGGDDGDVRGNLRLKQVEARSPVALRPRLHSAPLEGTFSEKRIMNAPAPREISNSQCHEVVRMTVKAHEEWDPRMDQLWLRRLPLPHNPLLSHPSN